MRRAPIATVAISVTALLAAACGVPTTGQAADETGRRGSVTSATAAPAVRAATPTASRPNIVFVLMDDFSMDLLPHDAQRARHGAARGVVRQRLRRRLAVLRLAQRDLHRAVPAPDRRPHQHQQPAEPARPARRLARLRDVRQPGAHLRGPAAGVRLRHGLRRQVPQRVRGAGTRPALPPVPPGWSDFRAIFGTAYDGWDFQGTRTTDKGTSGPAQLARAAGRRDAQGEGPRVRRHGDRQPGHEVPARSAGATRARTSSRSRRTPPTAASTTTRRTPTSRCSRPPSATSPGGVREAGRLRARRR